MRETFVRKRFGSDALDLIDTCNDILKKYEAKGYDLSLRQLYYQLVQKNIVPNTEKSYSRVGNVISDARLAGLVDWDMIKDRGRVVVSNTHWVSPKEILEASARGFKTDHWKGQTSYVEVMVEKQALEGVLIPVCRRLDVAFTANKGYASSSTLYEAGMRLREEAAKEEQRNLVVLYLGDHDPSGIDMTRDVKERLQLFLGDDLGYDVTFKVKRLALNMDQVRALKLPPNPAKMTDSRATEYVKKFGTSSWELDALDVDDLVKLVTDAVEVERDDVIYKKVIAKEKAWRKDIEKFAKTFK
jgi:hypothetical protein